MIREQRFNGGPKKSAASALHLTGVDRHPHRQTRLSPIRRRQSLLGAPGRGHRLPHRGESGAHPIPRLVEHPAPRLLHRLGEQPVVAGEHLGHLGGVKLPEQRRVDDVGHQERHRLHPGGALRLQPRVVLQDALLQPLQLRSTGRSPSPPPGTAGSSDRPATPRSAAPPDTTPPSAGPGNAPRAGTRRSTPPARATTRHGGPGPARPPPDPPPPPTAAAPSGAPRPPTAPTRAHPHTDDPATAPAPRPTGSAASAGWDSRSDRASATMSSKRKASTSSRAASRR